MKVSVYQIDIQRDIERACYLSLDSLKRIQGDEQIRSERYNKVYEGNIDCETLEQVYTLFNFEQPKGYNGRSLSVSDVVQISDSANGTDGFYFCDSCGFEKVDFDPEKAKTAEWLSEKEHKNKISVLLIKPMKAPVSMEIPKGDLKAMQDIVGGLIEAFHPFEDDYVTLVCNDEGKICGLPLNRAIYSARHKITEVIAGDFFLAYTPPNSDNFESLPPKLMQKYAEKFKTPERFVMINGQIAAIPCRIEADRNTPARNGSAR